MRISYSSLETLHTCERKFELEKLIEGERDREESVHFVWGKAYEVGATVYLLTQDKDKALFEAWLAYHPVLEEKNKSVFSLHVALTAAFAHLDNLLQDWEVAYFDGKPADQLSFRLWLNAEKTDYFVGHIDVVLRNKFSGQYAIFECKSTGLKLLDIDPLFRNSAQALGYSIVLDKIAGDTQTNYQIIYHVAQLGDNFQVQIHNRTYPKNKLDRLRWFFTLKLDYERIIQMRQLKLFPLRGSSCLHYMRPCAYFGTCDLHAADSYKREEVDPIEYQFTYELDALINQHIQGD